MSDPSILGAVIKIIMFALLWGMCARMIYQNELDRPESDRIGDLQVVKFLAVIWPIWFLGLFGILLGALAVGLVRLPFKLHKAFSK